MAAMQAYAELCERFPGKRIVIAEFGWPSSGWHSPRRSAVPGRSIPGRSWQAAIMRGFAARAQALGIDYNLIEACDQPWMAKTNVGSAGVHGGLFGNSRQPKFAWAGPLRDPEGWKVPAIAVAAGVLLSLPILGMARATLALAALLALAANMGGVFVATVFDYG
jgi:hypothetical protein